MILTPEEQIEEYTRIGTWGAETLIDLFLKNASATCGPSSTTSTRPDVGTIKHTGRPR